MIYKLNLTVGIFLFEDFGNASFVSRFHFLSHALPFLIFPVRSLTELIFILCRFFAAENMCAFFIIFSLYFYRFRVVLSLSRRFYRFSRVLSQLWDHVLIFSLFLVQFRAFL